MEGQEGERGWWSQMETLYPSFGVETGRQPTESRERERESERERERERERE